VKTRERFMGLGQVLTVISLMLIPIAVSLYLGLVQ
jgi:hypothetical protein